MTDTNLSGMMLAQLDKLKKGAYRRAGPKEKSLRQFVL